LVNHVTVLADVVILILVQLWVIDPHDLTQECNYPSVCSPTEINNCAQVAGVEALHLERAVFCGRVAQNRSVSEHANVCCDGVEAGRCGIHTREYVVNVLRFDHMAGH